MISFVFTTTRAFGRKCEHDRGSLARKMNFKLLFFYRNRKTTKAIRTKKKKKSNKNQLDKKKKKKKVADKEF